MKILPCDLATYLESVFHLEHSAIGRKLRGREIIAGSDGTHFYSMVYETYDKSENNNGKNRVMETTLGSNSICISYLSRGRLEQSVDGNVERFITSKI